MDRMLSTSGWWPLVLLALVNMLHAFSASQKASSPLCGALGMASPAEPTWSHNLPVLGWDASSSRSLNCSDHGRLVALHVRPHFDRHSARVGLFLCPGVKMLKLQLLGDTDRFTHVPVKVTMTSCGHTNDTIIIRKGRHRSHATLRFSIGQVASQHDWLNYSYSVLDQSGGRKQRGDASERPQIVNKNDHSSTHAAVRWRRSAQGSDISATPAPSVVSSNSDIQQDIEELGSISECGLSKTCIRYGRKECGHLSCDYMLSYQVNSTDVDMELSARGTGWVAVGFSSDKFMGGGDDVIACKREGPMSPIVVSMSLENSVKHNRPQQKRNRLTLLQGLVHNNHIYCRIRRPLKFQERIGDSDLDLVNDWHQLYAFGNIDGTGRILQHTETPRVSERKITMVRIKNILVPTSKASLPVSASWLSFLLFLLSLTLTFTGS